MNKHLLKEIAAIKNGSGDTGSRERIAHLLAEEGLDTPASFASLVMDLVQSQSQGFLTEPLGTTAIDEMARQIDDRTGDFRSFGRQPPSAAFYWQGNLMSPDDIHRINDRPLHSVVVGISPDDAKLVVSDRYSDVVQAIRESSYAAILLSDLWENNDDQPPLKEAQYFESASAPSVNLQVNVPPPEGDGVSPPPRLVPCLGNEQRPKGETQFFEHHNFDGDWFWLPQFHGRQNLRAIGWNDRISSIKGGERLTLVWDHINFQGNSHTFAGHGAPKPIHSRGNNICGSRIERWIFPAPRQEIQDLSIIGFNDKISSVAHL